MRTYDLLRNSVRHGAYAPCTPIQIQPMAIFHASTKHVTRSAGRSAVAAAAYRGGCVLTDERTGLVHDYTRKGGVVSSDLVLPDGQVADRGQLWSAAELAEKRKDARTAREWVIALPAELDKDERTELARSFAEGLAQRYEVAVDLAVHEPSRHGSDKNHHAHLLTTTRKVSRLESGSVVLGEKAHIEHSDKARRAAGLGSGADEVKAVREMWEGMANAALARAGQEARIDARSLKDQGVDREATVHLGPKAAEMERRGTGSDRGDQNRTVQANNQERTELVAKVAALQAEQARIEAEARRERLRQVVAAEQARRDEAARQEAERQEANRQEAARQAAVQAEQARKAAERAQLGQDEKTYDGLIRQETDSVVKQLGRIKQGALSRRSRRSDQELKIERDRPVQPTGLLAGLRRSSYEKAFKSWTTAMDHAKKLTSQAWKLEHWSDKVKNGPYPDLWKLAEKRIAKLYPELTERVQAFKEVCRAERAIQEQREKEERARKTLQSRSNGPGKGTNKGWRR